ARSSMCEAMALTRSGSMVRKLMNRAGKYTAGTAAAGSGGGLPVLDRELHAPRAVQLVDAEPVDRVQPLRQRLRPAEEDRVDRPGGAREPQARVLLSD